MGKFREYFKAVFHHWGPLMTGVFAALFFWVIGFLYEQRQGLDIIPWYVHVFVAIPFLFYACYRTWLDQDQENERFLRDIHWRTLRLRELMADLKD